jgi:hypothetical protein
MLKIYNPIDLSTVTIYEHFQKLPSHSFGISQRLKDGNVLCGDIGSIFAYARSFKNKVLSSSNGEFMILDNLISLSRNDISMKTQTSFIDKFLLPWSVDLEHYLKQYEERVSNKTTEQSKEDFRDLNVELKMIKEIYKVTSSNLSDTMKQKHFEFFETDILNKLDENDVNDRDVIMEIFKHISQNFKVFDENGSETFQLNEVKDFSLSLNLMQAIRFSTKKLNQTELNHFEIVKDDVISWVSVIENIIHGMSHIRDVIENPFKQPSSTQEELDEDVAIKSDFASIVDAVFLPLRDSDSFRGSIRLFCSTRMSELMIKALDMIEPLPLCPIDKVYLLTRYLVSPFLRNHIKKSDVENPLIIRCLNILIQFVERNEMRGDIVNDLCIAFTEIFPMLLSVLNAKFTSQFLKIPQMNA